MKRNLATKIVVFLAAAVLVIGMLAACGKKEEPAPAPTASAVVTPGDADAAAAAEVDELIAAIQVQEWTEGNDERSQQLRLLGTH